MRFATPALLALLVLTLAGCRTAKGVYTDAMALETDGRPEAAAEAYADALRRDAGLPNARGRLAVAGRAAIAARLAAAARLSTGTGASTLSGARSAAADEWLAAEALVATAAGVGVSLDRPATFSDDVDAACVAAVDALLDTGRDRADAGGFADALAFYDRARRYRPSSARRADLDTSARDAYTGWAAADLDAGRFRAAVGHADEGLALAAPQSDAAARLRGLRDDALATGTVVAAVFPAVRPRTPAGDALPRAFLRDLSDVLLDDRLAPPPPFVAIADPAEARRALRQSRGDLSGNARLLADLTRDLGADVGLVAEVDGFSFAEAETGRRDVTFRLRAGDARVPGVRVTTEMTLRVRADVAAVYADGRRLACGSDAPAVVVSGRYDTATTAADVQTLRLSDDERDLFGAARRDRLYDGLLTTLRDRLADSLAQRVGECVGRLVP